jgi:hypothetical protein
MCCLATYSQQTCAQRTTEAQNQTIAAMAEAQADRSCNADTDCVLASNTGTCLGGCGVVVNQAGAAQLASALGQIDSTVCASFSADGCVPDLPVRSRRRGLHGRAVR